MAPQIILLLILYSYITSIYYIINNIIYLKYYMVFHLESMRMTEYHEGCLDDIAFHENHIKPLNNSGSHRIVWNVN